MSRTFRRKNQTHEYRWLLREYVMQPEGFPKRVRIDPKSDEGRRKIARYHSDAAWTMGPAPHWYCNVFERVARQEVRRQLHNWMRDPEFVVDILANHSHDATWSWW